MVIAKSDYYPTFFTEGLKRHFFNIYDSQPVGDYGLISTTIPSDKDKETYAGMGTVPKLSEWMDERKVLSMGDMFKYEIVNKKYELTLGVERETLEDEQYGEVKNKIQDIALEVRRAYDEYVFGMLTAGTATNCYDGGYYFRTTHDTGNAVNQSNALSTAFSKTALQTAITTMRKYTDDRGRILNIQPDTLIVNPSLEWSARELLQAAGFITTALGSTSEAAITPNFNAVKGALNLYVCPFLTSTTEWYVACTSKALKPVILQSRVAPEFSALDNAQMTDATFMRDMYYYGIRVRFGLGYGPWQYCIQGNA